MRFFHVSYLTRGAAGFETFASEKFPNMDAMAQKVGVGPDNFVVTGLFEFKGVEDFEAFTGEQFVEEPRAGEVVG